MKHKLILKKNTIKIKGNLLENINFDINFYNNELSSLETNHNRIMYNLDTQYESKKERVIKKCNKYNTICYDCKMNCHMDCTSAQLAICLKCFPFMIGSCNVCGCSRERHDFNTRREYIDECKKVKINNYDKKIMKFRNIISKKIM